MHPACIGFKSYLSSQVHPLHFVPLALSLAMFVSDSLESFCVCLAVFVLPGRVSQHVSLSIGASHSSTFSFLPPPSSSSIPPPSSSSWHCTALHAVDATISCTISCTLQTRSDAVFALARCLSHLVYLAGLSIFSLCHESIPHVLGYLLSHLHRLSCPRYCLFELAASFLPDAAKRSLCTCQLASHDSRLIVTDSIINTGIANVETPTQYFVWPGRRTKDPRANPLSQFRSKLARSPTSG